MSCQGVLRYQCAGLCPRHARSGRPANPGLDVRPHWPVAITTMVTLLTAKPVAPSVPAPQQSLWQRPHPYYVDMTPYTAVQLRRFPGAHCLGPDARHLPDGDSMA